MRKTIRTLLSKWYLFLLWALVAVLLWNWIFDRATAPKREEKVTVFIGAYSCETALLSETLNKHLPEGLRAAEAVFYRSDDYYFNMYFTVRQQDTDLFLLAEKQAEQLNLSVFLALDKEQVRQTFGEDAQLFYVDDVCYGVRIYDKSTGVGGAADYVGYTAPDKEADNYCLLFNKLSPHLGDWNGATSSAALFLARYLMQL